MKYINLSLISLLALVSVLILAGFKINEVDKQLISEKSVGFYNNPTPGEISIVASTPIPDGREPSREDFIRLVDCGFNLGMSTESVEGAKKIFNLIDTLHFNMLIANGKLLKSDFKKVVDDLKDEPHLAGWKFIDEPHFDDLSQLSKEYLKLTEYCPEKLVYINIVGVLEPLFTGKLSSFPDYLSLIDKYFHPTLWSYDLYPFSIKNNELYISYDSFFAALEIFSKKSKETGYPFWTYCQSMAYKNRVIERPATTESYLRFCIFSSLAYGAQGIVYWTYGQRKSTNSETYLSALINLNGEITPAWYAALKVNNEIKKYNNVFYNSQPVNIKHLGKNLYKGTERLNGSIGQFNSITSGKEGILVSQLRTNNKDYYIFVNHSVENSQDITFKIKMGSLKLISSNDSSIFTPDRVYKLNLEKGGYFIFESIR